MKSVFISFIIILTFSTCYSQARVAENSYSLDWLELNGNIKILKESFYQANDSNGIIVKDFQKEIEVFEYHFDTKGKCLKIIETSYSKEDTSESITQFSYDEKGERVYEYTVDHDMHSYSIAIKFKYDEDNKLIEEYSYIDNDSLYEKKSLVYGENGNMIKLVLYSKAWCCHCYDNPWDCGDRYSTIDSVSRVYNYLYDSRNNLIKENEVTAKGKVVKTIKNYYTDFDKKYLREYYNDVDSLVSVNKWKYDLDTNLVEFVDSSSSGAWHELYNLNGEVLEGVSTGKDNLLESKALNKYNLRGDKTESKYYRNKEGKLNLILHSIINYRYDKNENWIIKVTESNGKPSYFFVRDISYF